MEKQPNSRMCFVCGIDNPIGLHLKFYTDGEGRCVARFRPGPEHQGFPGQLHGVIISTLLDEPTQTAIHADPLSVWLSITEHYPSDRRTSTHVEPRFFPLDSGKDDPNG